jgi:hypothetical protein
LRQFVSVVSAMNAVWRLSLYLADNDRNVEPRKDNGLGRSNDPGLLSKFRADVGTGVGSFWTVGLVTMHCILGYEAPAVNFRRLEPVHISLYSC